MWIQGLYKEALKMKRINLDVRTTKYSFDSVCHSSKSRIAPASSVISLQELRQAFRIFDKNRDGFIEAKELRWVTTTLGQRLTNEEIDAFMTEADLDGDGKLNYDEFVRMMTQV